MFAKPTVKKKESSKNIYISKINEEIKSELEAMTGIEYNLHSDRITESVDNNVFSSRKTRKESARSSDKSLGDLEKVPVKEKNEIEIIPYLSSSVSLSELQKVLKQQGNTSEDRYKILEARDRLMRLKQGKIHTLATAKVTIGTCPDMCPEKERLMREYQRQAASYELLSTDEYRMNHNLAVKQYSRSSADQEEPMPQDLRPVSSLKMTMSYLLHEIVDLADGDGTNLMEWYHFIWDRMRGIRKDITQQELCSIDSVELVEQCARFHIVCSERLCAEEAAVFDKKINTENLTKCLQTLKYMYHDLREKGIVCENEPEFRGYIILLNLNNANFMWDLQRLPSAIQKSPEVYFAIQVHSSIQSRNYVKFFKLVKKTTYLNACILLRYFFQVRVEALNVMVKAYCRTTSTAYPLYEFIDILGFEDENEAIYFCEQAGLNVSSDEMHIILNRQNICTPPPLMDQARSRNLVEIKRLSQEHSIGRTIAGDKMPEQMYLNHKPHNSFDSQGYLRPKAINANDQNDGVDENMVEADTYEYMDEDMLNDMPMETLKSMYDTTKRKLEELQRSKIIDDEQKSTGRDLRSKLKSTDKPSHKTSSSSSSNSSSANRKRKAHSRLDDVVSQRVATTAVSNNLNPFISPFSNKIPSTSSQANIFSQSQSTFSFTSPFTPSAVTTSSASYQIPQLTTSIFSQPIFKVPEVLEHKTIIESELDDKEEAKKENKRRMDEELKRVEEMRRREILNKINKKAAEETDAIITDVIHDFCVIILKGEIERMSLFELMSNKILDSLMDDCIREDVKYLLEREVYVQSKLEDISRRLKNRMVMKYVKIWRQQIFKIKQQRKALSNTPVWLPKQSLEKCAKAFYHKEQYEVIKNMRKSFSMSDFDEKNRKFLVPIETKIYQGLKENFKSLDIESTPLVFWKLIISWPNLRNRPLLARYKRIINQYLCPSNASLDQIVKIYKPTSHETLHICIKHIECVIEEENYTGMDALLFIATTDEDPKTIGKRLTKTLLSKQKLMPIPLHLIILGDDRDRDAVEPKVELDNLLKASYLSEYIVHHEKNIDESVILTLTQSAILWLTLNKSPPIPLEMDKLSDVFDDCLTEELWLRISGHAVYNPNLAEALESPKFIIDLFNESVSDFIDIVLDPENTMYTNFPDEFKCFLSNDIYLPCSYEYFDDHWKKESNREQIERVINSLTLPQWPFDWPIIDTMELHKSILRYCQTSLKDSHYPTVTCNILSNLFLMSDKDEITDFIHVIIEITKEKLRHINEEMKIVYDKNHIKLFRTLPWWFKSCTLMNYNKTNSFQVLQQGTRYTYEEIAVKRQRIDEEKAEVSSIIEKYDSTYEEYENDRDNGRIDGLSSVIERTQINDLNNASAKLDALLNSQRMISRTLDEKLEIALKKSMK